MTTTYNVNIVGSLTNNNGILGNFSTSNYALVNQTFTSALSTQDWEFVIPYLSTDLSASQYPMCSDDFGIGFGINNNGSTLTWYISNNGSSWNVVSGTSANYTFHTNTQYYFKLSHSSGTVYLSVSLDNNTYIQLLSASLTSMQDTVLKFGASRTNANPCTYGQIDLNKAYIKVNDVLWWKGVSNTSNITTKIQLRHDTAANWASVNPVLLEGEVGIETDTKKQKIGDGSTPWNNLAYDLGSTALQSNTTVIDGQWVQSQSIAGTSVAKGTYNISLSSYLPNDGYMYEVMVNLRAYSSNTSNAGQVSVYSDIFGKTIYNSSGVKGQGAAGGSSRQIGNTFILPVGTGRTITYEIEEYNLTTLDLVLWGYRRIGTNS